MNRNPVSGRRLRQIVENTGYKYTEAYELRDGKVYALRPARIPIYGYDADVVDTDEWRVWPALRSGVDLTRTVPPPLEITRDPTVN